MHLVIRRGVVLLGVGAIMGSLAAAAAGGLLGRILYGVSPADPVAWLAALTIVAGVGLAAHAAPARRAASVNPVESLRAE